MIELLKNLENKLNTLNDIEKSLETLPQILEANKTEVKTIKEALEEMSIRERDILTRICINGESQNEVAVSYNVSKRQMQNWKNNALKVLTRRIYGINQFEGEN